MMMMHSNIKSTNGTGSMVIGRYIHQLMIFYLFFILSGKYFHDF